jgi:hypothetical protein
MDFRLTDEQLQVKQMVKDFAESEIKPHVMEWDEAQTFPMDVVKKLGELGMLGIVFPEEYGGAGMSYIDYVNVIEELSAVDSSARRITPSVPATFTSPETKSRGRSGCRSSPVESGSERGVSPSRAPAATPQGCARSRSKMATSGC